MFKNLSFENIESSLKGFVIENGSNRPFWLILFFGLLVVFILLYRYLDNNK